MANPLELPFLDRRGQNPKCLQSSLVDKIWGLPASINAKDARIYLDHYNAFSTSIDTSALSFQSHVDALDVIEYIKNRRAKSRRNINAEISAADRDCHAINSIEA